MNEGGKVKKQSRTECNLEAIMIRFQSMTYFDQHMVISQCSTTILELLSSFISGSSNYLPVQEHVAYIFDLMEACNNIYGLIDLCISILKKLHQIETKLMQMNSTFVKTYTTTLSLYLVGVLRRYHRCLLCKCFCYLHVEFRCMQLIHISCLSSLLFQCLMIMYCQFSRVCVAL